MAQVNVIILRAPGTNCDKETAFAFEQAGAVVTEAHINRLVRGEVKLTDFQIMVVPGGFSYGDDIAAGKVLANELRLKLGEDVQRLFDQGGLFLGICNGFQVFVKAGILPELLPPGELPSITLAGNDSGRFECRWVHLRADSGNPCVFTRGVTEMDLPVAHGEGKVAVTSEEVLTDGSAALYYTDEVGNRNAGYPHNPNGSVDDIAGLCDASGRVFALMPHPERHIRGTQHPQWTRLGAKESGDGFKIFQNAVSWAKKI